MNSPSRTDRAFDALRKAPVEIPLEKVEQFVIAGAAAGSFSVAAASKFALKFHLNTIIAMSTAAAATLTGLILMFNTSHATKTPAVASKPASAATPVTFVNESLAVDSPAAGTTATGSSGATTTVSVSSSKGGTTTTTTTTTSTGSGGSVYVSTASGDGGTTTVVSTSDSAVAAYSYSDAEAPEAAEVEDRPTQVRQAKWSSGHWDGFQYVTNCGDVSASVGEDGKTTVAYSCCHPEDSLMKMIEDALVKDGLITDREEYRFSFDGKRMTVNGVEQSTETWERYKTLIEKYSDNKVNRRFQYMINVNGKSTMININNEN